MSLLNAFYGEPWAITEAKLSEIEEILLRHAGGERLSDDQIERAIAESSHTPESSVPLGMEPSENRMYLTDGGGTAYIPLHGSIVSRAGMFARMSGATSPQTFEARVRAAMGDEQVSRIVLDIDSPGGTVAGTMPAALAVREAAARKEVVAVSENMMASAAYWIGSQATRMIVGENARIGSIGVLIAHRDVTGAMEERGVRTTVIRMQQDKALGGPEEPLDDEAYAALQKIVSDHYAVFVKAVAGSRSIAEDVVQNDIGSATYIGADAVDLGLADEIGTLALVLSDEADPEPNTGLTMADNNQGAEDLRAEIDALRAELEETKAKAEEEVQSALDLANEQAETFKQSALQREAAELIGSVIRDGKALASQHDELLARCKEGEKFSESRISLVRSMYEALPENCAAPLGGEQVEEGTARNTESSTTVQGYDILEDLRSNLPQQYRN
jgi:signal peptide peptidase SppA